MSDHKNSSQRRVFIQWNCFKSLAAYACRKITHQSIHPKPYSHTIDVVFVSLDPEGIRNTTIGSLRKVISRWSEENKERNVEVSIWVSSAAVINVPHDVLNLSCVQLSVFKPGGRLLSHPRLFFLISTIWGTTCDCHLKLLREKDCFFLSHILCRTPLLQNRPLAS